MFNGESALIRTRQVPRFRWRLLLAVPLGMFGALAAAWGLYGVGYIVWLGKSPTEIIPFAILALFGVAWLVSAFAFMRSRWIFASVTASIAWIVYTMVMGL